MKRKIYSGELKAKIILSLLKEEKSSKELAEAYDIHPNLIKNWKSKFIKESHLFFDDQRLKR